MQKLVEARIWKTNQLTNIKYGVAFNGEKAYKE